MARRITLSRVLAAATAVGAVCPSLFAQTPGLPASDPVGISRSGAGVAYGRSLEAAALNPALLPTLDGRFEIFIASGEELESFQATLQSSQRTVFSTDRNRYLPSFGLGWKLGSAVALGLKVDTPFLRHGRLPGDTPVRFLGDQVDLKAQRVEFQLGFAPRNDFSIGVGAGIVKVDIASGTTVRGLIPVNPLLGASASNPSEGLLEQRVFQTGNVSLPSFSAGFRWAIAPRWTLAGAFQSGLKGTVSQKASLAADAYSVYANDGFSTPLGGTAADAATVLGLSHAVAGSDRISLPARASLGLRQRVNQIFTWELDLRYTNGSQYEFPSLPSLSTPSGIAGVTRSAEPLKNALGGSLMGEIRISKRFLVRCGASLDQGFRNNSDAEPIYGGQSNAAFSGGFGWQVAGGELNFGYQYRQAQDQDTTHLDGVWSSTGFRPTGSTVRVEGMGHLYSIGFKKIF